MPNLGKIAENCRDQNFEPSQAVETLCRVPSRYYQMVSTSNDNNSDSEGDLAGLNSVDGAALKLLNKKFQLLLVIGMKVHHHDRTAIVMNVSTSFRATVTVVLPAAAVMMNIIPFWVLTSRMSNSVRLY